jgi:hypothetical protein
MLWLAGTAVMTSTKGRRGSGNWVGWVCGLPTNTKKQTAKPAVVNAAEPNNRRREKRLLLTFLSVIGESLLSM